MARIRSIKPEFFLHEGLAELSALHRLLFVGLWTLADKYGRLEDRPKRIKAALFPWDDCDMEQLLADLAARGFIVRYTGTAPKGGELKAAIWIQGFEKHQKPHPKETTFDLPEPTPDVFGREISRLHQDEPGNFTAAQPEPATNCAESGGREISRQAANEHGEPGKGGALPGGLFVSGGGGGGGGGGKSGPPPPTSRPKPKPPAVTLPPQAEAWLVWQSGEWEQRFASLTSPPPAAEFLAWWGAAMADLHRLGQGEPELRTAYRAFLADDYWATKSRRRCPWAGWVRQWRDFLPAKGAGPPTRGKRLEVIPYPDAEVPDAAAV